MSEEVQRQYMRFDADSNTLSWISKDSEIFHADFVALTENESHTGVSIIMIKDIGLTEKDMIYIAVGHLGERKAKVCWIKNLDASVFRIGLEYIED